jgi:spore coat polysaccharide biosynthesis protein SpsF (cytidylyltransferase family)
LAVDEVLRVVDLPLRAATDSDSDLVGETVEFEGEEVKVLNTQQLLQEKRADLGATDG